MSINDYYIAEDDDDYSPAIETYPDPVWEALKSKLEVAQSTRIMYGIMCGGMFQFLKDGLIRYMSMYYIIYFKSSGPYEFGTVMEDHKEKNLPAISELDRKVRQRAYGILFFEKSGALNAKNTDFDDMFYVQEWTMEGKQN